MFYHSHAGAIAVVAYAGRTETQIKSERLSYRVAPRNPRNQDNTPGKELDHQLHMWMLLASGTTSPNIEVNRTTTITSNMVDPKVRQRKRH